MGNEARRIVELPQTLTVRALAERIQASPIDLIKQLMANGVMANINQQIDFETAAIIIHEMGFDAEPEKRAEEEQKPEAVEEAPAWRQALDKEDPTLLRPRPPVVTILGHVDHGKTSLLDAIRSTDVASAEAGGITQKIGAYQITHNNQLITFLDTPGHAAFTAMRARGAQVTDIVILVVAADDGVMPQTREALAHARAARVPIVVALNKIDKPNANPDKVKHQLSELELVPDDWGGDTMVVPVSAKKRVGVDDLLEAITLTADNTKILANPAGKLIGSVIEAQLDKAKGPIASLLVQNGTLRLGDALVAGQAHGKIRAMYDFHGAPIDEAGPSTPVSVLGLAELPQAGDLIEVLPSEREARAIAAERKLSAKAAAQQPQKPLSLDQVFARFQAGEMKELKLIVKADGQGSLEPIVNSLKGLGAEGLKVNILYAETGNITENDVMLASSSGAVLVGFAVQMDTAAQRTAETEGVSARLYDVIYRLTEDVDKALKGMLEPEKKQVTIGRAEVRAVFSISKIGKIAGCIQREGEGRRNARVRVLRSGKVVHEGEIGSLRHEKDDVREVRQGFECGVGIRDYQDFQVGDILEFFVLQEA
ncbi:MAG: translation initiation factor IF-2 [Anaerolineales bacterium]|nr:translation initiation factor IF-2 [Anaerolineales bacterium]